MVIAIDYFILIGFCFSVAAGLFLILKSKKLI